MRVTNGSVDCAAFMLTNLAVLSGGIFHESIFTFVSCQNNFQLKKMSVSNTGMP